MPAQLINKVLIVNHSDKIQTVNLVGTNIECPPGLIVSVPVTWNVLNQHLEVLAANNQSFSRQGMQIQVLVNNADPDVEAYTACITIPSDKVPEVTPADITEDTPWLLSQKIEIGVGVTVVGTALGWVVKKYVQKPIIRNMQAKNNIEELEKERLELERRAKVIRDSKNKPVVDNKRKLKFDEEDPEVKKARKLKQAADDKERARISKKEQDAYEKELKLKNKEDLKIFNKAKKDKLAENLKNSKKISVKEKVFFEDNLTYVKKVEEHNIKQVDVGINNVSKAQRILAEKRKLKFVKEENLVKIEPKLLDKKVGTFFSDGILKRSKNGMLISEQENKFLDSTGKEISSSKILVNGKKLVKNARLSDKDVVTSGKETLIMGERDLANDDFFVTRKPELINGKKIYNTPEGIVNEDGNYIDENGAVIDSEGRFLDAEHKFRSTNGNIVTKDGNYIKNGAIKFDGLPEVTKAVSDRTAFTKKMLKLKNEKESVEKKFVVNDSSLDSKLDVKDVIFNKSSNAVNKEITIVKNDDQLSDQFKSIEEKNSNPDFGTDQFQSFPDSDTEPTIKVSGNVGQSSLNKGGSDKDVNNKIKADNVDGDNIKPEPVVTKDSDIFKDLDDDLL